MEHPSPGSSPVSGALLRRGVWLGDQTHRGLREAARPVGRGQAGTYQVQAPGGGHGALRLPAAQASVGVRGVLMGNTATQNHTALLVSSTQKPTSWSQLPPHSLRRSTRRPRTEGRTEGRTNRSSEVLPRPPPSPPPGAAAAWEPPQLQRQAPPCPRPVPPPAQLAPGRSERGAVLLGRTSFPSFNLEFLSNWWFLGLSRNCPLWTVLNTQRSPHLYLWLVHVFPPSPR